MTDLEKKIHELFEYRQLPLLLSALDMTSGEGRRFEAMMVELQVAIFNYDQVLEESWMLDDERLKTLWLNIEDSLAKFGANRDRISKYLHQIEVYASNEKGIRQGRRLSEIPFWVFYYYKSCDVRLMRRLIYRHTQYRPDNVPRYSDWMLFDLVTEINDDITDLKEDIGTYNGNRLLHEVIEKGWSEAMVVYSGSLEDLGGICRQRMGDSRFKGLDWLLNLTRDECTSTLEQLYRLYEEKDSLKINEALVMNEGII